MHYMGHRSSSIKNCFLWFFLHATSLKKMTSHGLKVRREKIAACMTCSLCNELLVEATTICECLHSFCKKCITDKLTEGDLRCCPECGTDLGTHPLNKLRADHDLQDLRTKIFPPKKTKAKAVEATTTSSVPLPAKKKERSLSSLGVDPPREATQSSAAGTQTNSAGKRVTLNSEPTFLCEENVKVVRNPPGNTNTPQIVNQIANGNGSTSMPSTSVRRRKLGRPRKVAPACEVINIPDDPVVDVPSSVTERGANPIWFSLVASTNQEGIAPLPQIPSPYLKIKDGRVPVSYIKKYLVNKLNLVNEFEVDITLQGQSLPDTWQLQELVNLWLQNAPSSQVIQTTVGSSAKDVVMVLQYGRKIYGV